MKAILVAVMFIIGCDTPPDKPLTKACYNFYYNSAKTEVCFLVWEQCQTESARYKKLNNDYTDVVITTCYWK